MHYEPHSQIGIGDSVLRVADCSYILTLKFQYFNSNANRLPGQWKGFLLLNIRWENSHHWNLLQHYIVLHLALLKGRLIEYSSL